MGIRKRGVYRAGVILLIIYLLATFVFISLYIYEESKYPKVEIVLGREDLEYSAGEYRYEFNDLRPGQIELWFTEYADKHILGIPISDTWRISVSLADSNGNIMYHKERELSLDDWFDSYRSIKFEIDVEDKDDYSLIIQTLYKGTGNPEEFDHEIEISYESSPTPLSKFTSFTCFCIFPFILIVGVILLVYGMSMMKKEKIEIIPKEVELDEWMEWDIPESQDASDLKRFGMIGRIVGLINTISNAVYMIVSIIALGLLVYIMIFTSEWTESCTDIFALLSGIAISFFLAGMTFYFALASFAQYKAGCYAVDGKNYGLTKTYLILGIIGNFLKGSALFIILYVALEAANWICCLGSILFLFQMLLMILGIISFIGVMRNRNAFTN